MKYASFWQRLIAHLFEGQLQMFVVLLILSVMASQVLSLPDLVVVVLTILVLVLWSPVAVILYYTYFTSSFGGPLGKLFVGITVTDEKDNNLSPLMAFFRSTVGYTVANLVFGLGYYWIFRSEKRQGWHDMITGSVVTNQAGSVGRTLAVAAVTFVLVILNGYFLVNTVKSLGSNGLLVREVQHFFEDLEKTVPAPQTPIPEETLEI